MSVRQYTDLSHLIRKANGMQTISRADHNSELLFSRWTDSNDAANRILETTQQTWYPSGTAGLMMCCVSEREPGGWKINCVPPLNAVRRRLFGFSNKLIETLCPPFYAPVLTQLTMRALAFLGTLVLSVKLVTSAPITQRTDDAIGLTTRGNPGAIYLCTGPNWTGTCQYVDRNLITEGCTAIPSAFARAQSIGGDQGPSCSVYSYVLPNLGESILECVKTVSGTDVLIDSRIAKALLST